MFSGISGLKGFQSSMDVIGNNIANVNTVGFKVSRTTFQSMLNQTVVGAKSPETGGRGGTNAMQIGLGSQLGSIGKIMTQGSFQNTGKKTDLGLQGDGFFVLSDGLQDFYSRAGNFELDENGNFIQPATGLKLQGWISKIDPKTGVRYLDLDKPPRDLFIQAGMTMPAKATSNAYIGGNLNSKVGIEPLTITVKNPDDPTKNYKVRFSFEKLPPYDTKRLFSSSTIKYTWHAELVDWNAENPSEIPELNFKTGMVELNQFGQIEKFYRYPESEISGEGAGASAIYGDYPLTADVITDAIAADGGKAAFLYNNPDGTSGLRDLIDGIFSPNGDALELSEAGIQIEYLLNQGGVGNEDFVITSNQLDFSGGASDWAPSANDEIYVEYDRREDFSFSSAGFYTVSGPVLDANSDSVIDANDFTVTVDGVAATFTYDSATGILQITGPGTGTTAEIQYRTSKSFIADGSTKLFALESDQPVTGIYNPKITISQDNLTNTLDTGTPANNRLVINNANYVNPAGFDSENYNILYKTTAPFDGNIIKENGGRTSFYYSPSGSDAASAVKRLFDENDDGILDKIITNVAYNVKDVEYTLDPSASTTGSITNFSFGDIKPASGDLVNITYYTQEDIEYIENKTQYNISGPILNSQGTDDISTDDMVVYALDASGNIIATYEGDTDFTYDNGTGTLTFITAISSSTDKIRVEYATKDSFTGDGTTGNWDLTKKVIAKPMGFADGESTNGENLKVSIDLNFTLNETNKALDFRTDYPSSGEHAQQYSVEYANPNNPQEFDTVSVIVSDEVKAQVSIPKTGDIKFFDKNDTQNYVIGDYESPKYTTSSRFYDSLGNAYTVFFEYQKIAENQWAWRATEESGISIRYLDDREREYTPNPNDLTSIVGGVVEFDSAGRVSDLKAISQNGKIQDINISRIKFDPGKFIDDGAAPPPAEGATAVNASIDFSELVQFNSEFSASITSQDGNSMGVLQNYAINPAGEVVGTFSNGKSDVLGQIALAIFNNPSGLTEMGNTLFQVSANSGIAQVGLPGSGGRGTVSPGVLEMSNVDLAEEFTGMVIVQRAFQANARTVTTVDQILQELVNLKR